MNELPFTIAKAWSSSHQFGWKSKKRVESEWKNHTKRFKKSGTGYTNIFSSVAQGVIQTSCTSSSQTPV